MNYYPGNFYSNYNNNNANMYIPFQQVQQQQQPQQNSITVKIVDSKDIARISEIPFNGIGIFAKADMSELYTKTWNDNGTTKITTYTQSLDDAIAQGEENKGITALLLERISNIENKIDNIVNLNNTTTKEEDRKEIVPNAY